VHLWGSEKELAMFGLVVEHARARALTGGHHFGDYAALSTPILDAMPR